MQYRRVCIEALGYEIPSITVTSEEIEKRLSPLYDKLNLAYGRLEMMTGIRERRFWNKGLPPSNGSTNAGWKAIERSGIAPSQIECLIHASVSRDFLEPATATIVHNNLGLPPNAMVFDISNACLGFLNGIIMVANMIDLGQIKCGSVVAGESAGPLVEKTIADLLSDPNTTRNSIKQSFPSLTIGSGAVAAVLTDISISKTKHKLLGGTFRAATMHNKLCRGGVGMADSGLSDENNMPHMTTDAETLLINGCKLAVDNWNEFKKELGWSGEKIERTFCHQVGSAHRKAIYNVLDLDLAKDFSTFEFLGNVGSVSLPITLAIAEDQGRLEKNENIAMLGIGSGINSLMLGISW